MTKATGWGRETSPIHSGERELQSRVGMAEKMDSVGRAVIRPFMPDQHRAFFAQLPAVVIGSVDPSGAPWASLLFGEPGFVSSPDDRTLAFAAAPTPGDPLNEALLDGTAVGVLGIEPPTRRRNRMNGIVRDVSRGGFSVSVVQSFGNCPRYIQSRTMAFERDPRATDAVRVEHLRMLDSEAASLICAADTFFVASHDDRHDATDSGGADVSHRGGNPGFVLVRGDTLTIPDFAGNNLFNTLGNFLVNPRAGLTFVDYETGDLLQLSGSVELLWDATPDVEAFEGAERAWRFTVERGVRIRSGSPLRWEFVDASPHSLATGEWPATSTAAPG